MSRTIQIRFSATATIHRIRNFAEELSLALAQEQKLGALEMKDADTAADRLLIGHVPAAKVTRSISLVRELLSAHKLKDESELIVLERI